MGLKNSADWRTLLWAVLGPSVVALQYARPELVKYLFWVSCYFALSFGVIAHNHNHVPTFKSKWANDWFGNWLSIFYGYPTFAWIPTHNLNHHRYVNTAGDATITWRFTNKHNIFVAATYFFVSSYYQSDLIKEFIRKAKANNPKLYAKILSQYAVWIGAHLFTLALALALHGTKTGFYVWALTMGLPAFFALWTIMLFNYDQHVHADPWNENHSRSWSGSVLNFWLFNNGFHAAHHENPGEHWSNLKEVHARIEGKIDPALKEVSLFWYWTREYLLAPFFPSLGSKQLGQGPMNDPRGARAEGLAAAEIELGEAGSNSENRVRLA